jgi:hypothetical protein
VYYLTDVAIRGHVLSGSLALVLRKEMQDWPSAAKLNPEWDQLLADLDHLQEVEAEQDSKHFPTHG